MRIVLDTNIVTEDYLLKSARFAILFDYVRKTESTIVLTKIVADELAGNYERLVRKHLASIGSEIQALKTFTFDVDVPTLSERATWKR